ncbi:hypothetical protein [Sphingomonas lenta]|uniref:hypothetical protein n=1 Tax=Sphingomonas lenta TaxID=1141887 RepID=UPI0011410BFE|nr:hypothetical protein [Sphingomonas lenta]
MTVKSPALRFPSRAKNLRAHWAPILFSPRPDSPERIVVGVVAVSATGHHLAEANAWRRLHCLFEADAETAQLAIQVAFERMRETLAKVGVEGLTQFRPPFTGISLGEARIGEARSERELAEAWLANTSSLFDADLAARAAASASQDADESVKPVKGDRLPILVREYVEHRRPGLAQAFSPEFQAVGRKVRTPAQKVRIAFSGSVLVANFATLPARPSKVKIEHVKSLIWDLEQGRARDHYGAQRRFEMIVQHQSRDDPQITARQYETVLEVLDELGEQARLRDLAMRPYTAVPQIGDHLIEFERRAA